MDTSRGAGGRRSLVGECRTGAGGGGVLAGAPAELALDVPDNRFFRLSFRYARTAPCTIRRIRFERFAAD